MTQTSFCQIDTDLTSKGMLKIWLETMDTTSSASRIPFPSTTLDCSAQESIAHCETAAPDSGLPRPFGFPSDYAATEFNVWMPFDSSSVLLGMARYVHNVRKDGQETEMLSANKVWKIAIVLVCKLGRFVITCLLGSSISAIGFAAIDPKFQLPKT